MGRERDVVQQPLALTAEELVAVNPYNPDILHELENYVNDQVSLSPLFSYVHSIIFHFL